MKTGFQSVNLMRPTTQPRFGVYSPTIRGKIIIAQALETKDFKLLVNELNKPDSDSLFRYDYGQERETDKRLKELFENALIQLILDPHVSEESVRVFDRENFEGKYPNYNVPLKVVEAINQRIGRSFTSPGTPSYHSAPADSRDFTPQRSSPWGYEETKPDDPAD